MVYGARDVRSAELTHSELIELAARSLYRDYDIVATEFTPYKQALAFDVIAFRRWNREIRIIECKASRSDFLGDKKWHRYLPYCTRFAFFGPPEAFSRNEVSRSIGIIRPLLVTWERYMGRGNGRETLEWHYERGCRHLHTVQPHEYLRVLEGLVGCYSRCFMTCPRRKHK